MPDITGAELRARIDAGSCVLADGELVLVHEVTQEELTSCHFQSGSGFTFPYTDEEPLEPDAGPPAPPRKAPAMSKSVTPPSASPLPPEPSQAPTQAIVEQAPALPAQVADLKAALPADANIFTVLLGGIAVLGGGAAWKFYSDHSKRKHEAEMARIEKQDSQPGECKGHGVMKAELSSVASKVEAVAGKVEALEKRAEEQRLTMGDWDVDDVQERLGKLEKKVKKLRKGKDGQED